MKIKDLIKVFEQLLPIYKKACKCNWDYDKLYSKELHFGLCNSSYELLNVQIISVMSEKNGYYKNFLGGTNWMGEFVYLFPKPKTGKDLKSRIDFMEAEIKDLKRLLKKGYTHV